MADTVRTLPTDQRITHHLSLSQGATKLGLILCNGRGDPDPTAIPQGKMPSRALQFSQGDPDYSDMELPYTPITQKDWSGGRGQEDFEKDKSRYSDSQAIDAMYGDVILGPKVSTAIGSGTPLQLYNAQEESEIVYPLSATPYSVWQVSMYNYVETLVNYYGVSLPTWTYLYHQSYASRFLANFAAGGRPRKINTISLWLAKTNSVTITIFNYNTIDYSTKAKRFAFLGACTNTLADPAAVSLVSQTYSIVESATLQKYEFNFDYTLLGQQYYVICVQSNKRVGYYNTPNADYQCVFGVCNTPSTLDWKFSLDFSPGTNMPPPDYLVYGNYWHQFYENSIQSLAYEINAVDEEFGDSFFFDLRNSKFLVISPPDRDAPTLYMEGYHGYAADNTANQTIIHAKNVGQDAVGAIVKIVAGKGSTERTRWRTIVSVVEGASGYCVVDREWDVIQDTTTEYSILGTTKWTAITGHGLTSAVTDVCVVNSIVYFAQGEDVAIRRMTFYNSSGVWTPKYWGETAKATFLELIQNEEGVQKIWRALSAASTVASSTVAAWADAANILSFGTDIICGNVMYRINGLVAYGTPRIPFVLKEDGFGSISNSIYDQIPLNEFAAVADDNNGRAHLQRGVYLYLSMLNGLERYYEGRLDDMGPNRDLGLPNVRNGYISHLIAYPGRMYASIDHPNGYSSILLYNEIGWHEIYRTVSGGRIYTLDVQVIDGSKCDRLLFSGRSDCLWLPIAIDPKKQNDYSFAETGSIETAWINGNFKEIKKYFSSIVIYSDNLSAEQQYVRISYKVDSDMNPYLEIDENVNQSPSQEIDFPNHNVSGKRIKIKLTLYTTETLESPRIRAITLKPVTRLPIKKSWTLTYKVDDNLFDLQGEKSTLTAAQLQAQLEAWSSSETTPAPLYMEHPHEMYNGKYVFVEPESVRPIEWVKDSNNNVVAIGQLSVFEAD